MSKTMNPEKIYRELKKRLQYAQDRFDECSAVWTINTRILGKHTSVCTVGMAYYYEQATSIASAMEALAPFIGKTFNRSEELAITMPKELL